MQHKEYEELIRIYLFDEIDEVDKKNLEQHLQSCNKCKNQLEELSKMLDHFKDENDSQSENKLLIEARAELRGYLRAQKNKLTFSQKLSELISSFTIKPLNLAFGSLGVLLVGIFMGYMIFKTPTVNMPETDLDFSQLSKIQNINFLDPDPTDGEVEFTYESVKAGKMKGSINDSQIQKLLTYAMLNEQNPGTRLNSINVINASNQPQKDDELKSVLIAVAKYDNNPGVRREAIKSLNELTADKEIKDALIYVLLNDTASGIRIEAINSLMEASKKGIKLNQNDLTTLKDKIQLDENNYVRYQLKNIVKEY